MNDTTRKTAHRRQHPRQPGTPPRTRLFDDSRRMPRAVIKGQDSSRYRDVYHTVMTAPWWLFFLGVFGIFILVNVFFAALYLLDPHGIQNARPGSFWDAFLFSVQTIGSENGSMLAKSNYAYVIVTFEAFFAILNLAVVTGATFARFSKPYARIVFSKVAVIAPFDGAHTLMFRAANQRGNQILDASISVSFARQVTTLEGITMRRFEEIELVRSRTPLFGLSWTVMHKIDEKSPLYGYTHEQLEDMEFEIIVLLSGTDDTLADVIYARHSYTSDEIVTDRRFVDVISISASGRRIVDLSRFHDTEPLSLEPADASG